MMYLKVLMIGLFVCLSSINVSAESDATRGLQEQNVMSTLWFQTSGETAALYYQGYNLGKLRLDELLKQITANAEMKPAIVLDIDETVLDNSPFFAQAALTGAGDLLKLYQWFEKAEAKPLPGAVDFLKYAHSKGVEIFYITNRFELQREATIKNLKKIGAPQADANHVLLLQPGEQGKQSRREQVAKNYQILLLFGDNLGDFKDFTNLPPVDRKKKVHELKEEWGRKFVVFPNPMYGDWEWSIYQYDLTKSPEEMIKRRKDALKFN